MLFERLVVHHEAAPEPAALNMAIDQALLEQAALPTLRLYRWQEPSLSFGYFGKFHDVEAQRGSRHLVRRSTGGGIVFHGDDLTYALIVPKGNRAPMAAPTAIYAAVHIAIRDVLTLDGKSADLASASGPQTSTDCFANPVPDDLMLHGRKIAGAAQRRTRRGFLQQGSIQLSDLSESFPTRFAQALSPQVELRPIAPETLARAETLVKQRYATEEWLRRR